jgi:hypothetical protein
MVCWLFGDFFVFSSILALLGIHDPIEGPVTHLNLSPFWFLILTQEIRSPSTSRPRSCRRKGHSALYG